MTTLAIVLLVLGFLFATLQYPALMRRFWKWTLIGVGSLALAVAVAVLVIVVRENKPNGAKLPEGYTLDKPNFFDQFDEKPKQQAQHGPWEDYAPKQSELLSRIQWLLDAEKRGLLSEDTLAALQEARSRGLVPQALAKPRDDGNSLEKRIDQALERAAK